MTNRTIIQYFEWYVSGHHILWRKCAKQAAALADVGITAVWLPPAFKTGFMEDNVGYAAYDLYDLGEFDQKGEVATKYGTKDEYLEAIKQFHNNGVEVLADIVLNHKMGSDDFENVEAHKVNSSNRYEAQSGKQTISAPTKFDFKARKNKYSSFKWNASHFNGVDWNNNNHDSSIYLFEGKNWADDVDRENGNYDFLMGANVDMSNPEVREELLKWGQWYLDFTKVDGFRLDAVKHISAGFYEYFLDTLRKNNKREIFAVGEYWHGDVNRLHDYLEKTHYKIALFDVPLHYNICEMSYAEGKYDLRRLFNNTLMERHPENAVTFIDNHDSQPGQALSSFVNVWMKQVAYAIILLHENGTPCVFYGDYYGIPCTRNIPIPRLRTMIRIRKSYAYGKQNSYIDSPDVIGWTREGDDEHPDSGIAVVLSDITNGSKRMYIGNKFAGKVFRDAMRKIKETVVIGNDGWADFPTQSHSAAIWVTEAAFEELVITED